MSSCCAPSGPADGTPRALPSRSGRAADLVEVPGGTFLMGYEGPLANPGEGEGPVRPVAVEPYRIGATTVTNEGFAAFVAATGWVTEAERTGWSFVPGAVVTDPSSVRGRVVGATWWCAVDDASWRAPGGPGSVALDDHPVVHVSAHDAEAYCAWTGTRLPTEAEWERAARGGLEQAVFPWGDEPLAGRANTWQGTFPTGSTGPVGTVPARSYAPNRYGLHQAVGNVWEWTADAWSVGGSVDPARRVRKGGSYLCHNSYCNRYRVAARDASAPDDATGNIGFRVVAPADT